MNNKDHYKDINKWRETCREQRKRYYNKTSKRKNYRKPWTEEEINMIINSKLTDHEISDILERSVQSIQIKRCRINAELNKVVGYGKRTKPNSAGA